MDSFNETLPLSDGDIGEFRPADMGDGTVWPIDDNASQRLELELQRLPLDGIGFRRDLGKQVILDANVLRTDGATGVGIMRYAGQTSVVDIMQAHQMTHRLPRV